MKHYTTLEQSKKLIELGLNPNTADMFWSTEFDMVICTPYLTKSDFETLVPMCESIPCWSLGALLEVMPDGVQTNSNRTGVSVDITFVHNGVVTDSHGVKNNTYIEAAYNMVVWLLKNGYIKKGE